MFRRGGKLSLLSSKDDRVKVINERINLTERHFVELCTNFAACSRKLAKYRNSYDELAKGFKSYADEEDINGSLSEGMKSFTNSMTVLADYMDIEVHRMELKIINELSQFENICKATRETLRVAVVARDKEALRQKQMIDIKSKFSANTSAADSELIKAKLEVNRANKEIDEIMNNFEKRKLHDLKQVLTDFVLISMKQHTKALEALSATYYDISNIDEKSDLKDFQKLMNCNDESLKKSSSKKGLRTAQSLDDLDRNEVMSPSKSRNRLTRSTKNLSTETQTDDEGDEETDADSVEEEEEESNSESEESGSQEEDQSEETESDIPQNSKKPSTRQTVKPKPTTSIGIPKESPPLTAFSRLVTVTETVGDPPTATPRQPIDCSGRRK